MVVPNFEVYGQGRSTPIEAIELKKPIFVDIDAEIDSLWEKSQAWKNCERWNAEGKVVETEEENKSSLQIEFEQRCAAIPLTDIETAALLEESGGDYTQALAALTGDDINAAFENAEDNPE